jgi:hypothetical protein
VLGCTEIETIEICLLSWEQLAHLAIEAQRRASHAEKRLLKELLVYFEGLMTLQNYDSNWVYVVSLGAGAPEGWQISWIDIVKKRSSYFHPVGDGWPKAPPNYIAFRYAGKLQSIHHIKGVEVFTDPGTKFKEIPNLKPHFLYSLGPAFLPAHEVKMDKLSPMGRHWCMLDTFFVSNTVSDARDLSATRGTPAFSCTKD